MRRVTVALTAAAGFAVIGATPALAATSYPNDYFFAEGDQWALTGATASIQAPAAWCTSTGSGEIVAMVDTGADFGHPDLQGKLRLGAAFTGGTATSDTQPTATDQASLTDVEGHGTLTTGLAVADTGNGEGIAAVAPDATAMVMQVRSSDGTIWESDVALAIEYAADHGANVINVSIEPGQYKVGNTNVPDLSIPFAAQYAANAGAAVVLAAGNGASSQAVYPNLSGIALVVGALTPSGTMASYSNHGTDVSIYAPGGDVPSGGTASPQNAIISTYIRSSGYPYAVAAGTSLSAPIVSGAVALLMAQGDNAQKAMNAITSNAVHRNNLPELDAARALGASDSQRCGTPSTPPPGPPPTIGSGNGSPNGGGHSTPPPQITHSTTSFSVTTTYRTQTTVSSSASSSTLTVIGSSSTPGMVQGGGDNAGGAGRTTPPPPATAPGGVPAPVVAGGLVALVACGAPLGARLLRLRRGRGLFR